MEAHLGLDAQRSWIIARELNSFVWPGFDIHPVPGGRPGQFHYGFLPPESSKRSSGACSHWMMP